MAVIVNKTGVSHAKQLIMKEQINRSSSWGFSASDGDALLGAEEDWKNFGWFHLAVDTDVAKDTKGYWKYPYGKNGRIYRRGVIAAKARAAQQNETDIVNAADELLNMIDKEEKSKIKELLEKALSYLTPNQTEAQSPDPTGFIVRKGLDDKWRWFAWVTNKWLDRHNQIITDEAHKEFLKYLDDNPNHAPELWVWHTPGTARTKRADWWDYTNGFFLYSGELTEEEAEQYKDMPNDIGMSHGFYVLQYDFEQKHIMKYRTFEVSELPRNEAANPYTYFETIQEENKMFDSKRREYLVTRFGEDTVTKLEGDTETREKMLVELGVTMKQLETDWEEKYEKQLSERIAKASETHAEAIVNRVVKDLTDVLNMEELQKTILDLYSEIEALKDVQKEVTQLREVVAHLKETEDVKIAEAITPTKPFLWGRSTQSKDNVIEEDELDEEVAKQVKSAKQESGNSWLKPLRPEGASA